MSFVSLKKCALCVAFVATSVLFVGCAEETKKPGAKPTTSSATTTTPSATISTTTSH